MIFPYVSEGSSAKRQTSFRKEPLPVLWEVEIPSVSQPVLPAQLSSDFPLGGFYFYFLERKKKKERGLNPFLLLLLLCCLRLGIIFGCFSTVACSPASREEAFVLKHPVQAQELLQMPCPSTGAPPNAPSQHRSSCGHGDSCCLPFRAGTRGCCWGDHSSRLLPNQAKKCCQLTCEICGHGKTVFLDYYFLITVILKPNF